MIKIDENLYITKGAERKCYTHPCDNKKLLKIEYNNTIDRNQNKLDDYYYKYLQKKNVSFEHIPKYYGTIRTDKGEASIFEKIMDYNGSPSETFENIIKKQILSKEKEQNLLKELKNYLETNNIVFGDVVLSNILCQKIDRNNYKLIIIDGLGARRFGFKLWLHLHSKIFTKFRINKQWKKLLKNYNLVKGTL